MTIFFCQFNTILIHFLLYLIHLITFKYFSILLYMTYPVKFMKHPVYKSLMFYNLPTLSQFYISPSHYMFHILNRNCNVYSKCFIDCHVVKAYCICFSSLETKSGDMCNKTLFSFKISFLKFFH